MNYGYFDNKKKEYVITNPRTPAPWMNYIGNGGFGGIVSATGGGLTFDKDPSNRRVTRYKFDNLLDRPGRYLYIYDTENGGYYSPTWQPVLKDLDAYECRHGMGYTTISGCKDGLESSVTYCVPLTKNYELWTVKLHNKSAQKKSLKIFSYVEFSWNDAQYDMLCHWPSMAFRATCDGSKIVVDTVAEQLTAIPMYDYIATDLPVCGYDCSKKAFIGLYRDESNPIVLEKGVCTDSSMFSDNCCGVLCSEITLAPGEEKVFHYTLGATDNKSAIDEQIADAFSREITENAVNEIKKFWDNYQQNLQVNTPCDDMNTMLNIWHAYQAKTTFDWSRFISVYERGVDRGFGFRDSMQDVLGVMHAEPEKAKERIKLLLSVQLKDGSARSVYYPATRKSVGGGRSDDHLWSVFSVCNYVKETGNFGFLHEEVPYDDGGSATVLEHLEKGIEFTMNHLGKHGIPDMLKSDWDDSLAPMNKGGTAGAESVFVFFQLAHGAYELLELYKAAGLTDRIGAMQKVFDYCKSKVDVIWDGEYFIRAFTPEGEKFCTKDDEMNQIHLIPQAWAVFSHVVPEDMCNTAMDNLMKYLYTDKGIISHYKASDGFDPARKSYFLFPPGARENGGIFFHSNAWPIIALAMLGRSHEAFKCYEAILPTRRNDIADLCLTEPYVYSQTMIAPPHPEAGACVNSWLTGTASWVYYGATQHILGVRPEYRGLCIDPKVPSTWDGFTVTRKCRGKVYRITAKKGENKGVYVGGQKCADNLIPWDTNGENIEVTVIL